MINFKYEKLDIIDSTTDYLIRQLEDGTIDKDKIVVAREQTAGHGLSDKNFVSMKDVGIYFSYLHFYEDVNELKFITQKTAVAVYQTFKSIFNIVCGIKWVNDIYYNNKKVAGILCRNLIRHKALIIGIGIDLFKNDNLPDSIKDIAGYFFKDKYELLDKLNKNDNLDNKSCLKKNIYEDFKTLKIDGIEINDQNLWEPDHIVIEIVMHILSLIKMEGLPDIYIEKNIVKDKKIYEDCELQC